MWRAWRADEKRVLPPRFAVGDRVMAKRPLGGFWRPRVPRGTRGVIIGRGELNDYTVAFGNGECVNAPGAALAEWLPPPPGPG